MCEGCRSYYCRCFEPEEEEEEGDAGEDHTLQNHPLDTDSPAALGYEVNTVSFFPPEPPKPFTPTPMAKPSYTLPYIPGPRRPLRVDLREPDDRDAEERAWVRDGWRQAQNDGWF